ncbi:MAG: hypothetical protein ACI8XB_001353 [Patiriisocius sp.]|jgi:hypothetical protein
MPNPIFDFLAHFSFKPANSKNFKSGKMPDPDHYFERFRTKNELGISLTNMIKGVLKTSQVHGEAASEGQLRIFAIPFILWRKSLRSFLSQRILPTSRDIPCLESSRSRGIRFLISIIYNGSIRIYWQTTTRNFIHR